MRIYTEQETERLRRLAIQAGWDGANWAQAPTKFLSGEQQFAFLDGLIDEDRALDLIRRQAVRFYPWETYTNPEAELINGMLPGEWERLERMKKGSR